MLLDAAPARCCLCGTTSRTRKLKSVSGGACGLSRKSSMFQNGTAALRLPKQRASQAREQATIEIAIGLTGIAAQDRYRFGWVPDHEFIGSWQFNEWQLEDFHLVRDLVAEVDM